MKQRRKILFAVTKGNWGGAQRYVFDLATNLPTDEYEVVVLCGEGERLQNKLTEKGVRVIRIGSLRRDINLIGDINTAFTFYNILKAEKPDVVHLNSSKIGLIGSFVGRIANTPHIIFTGHGWAWNEDRSLISKSIFTIGHWCTVLMAHRTIAVSEKIKKQITHLPFINKSKIVVIYNGVANIEYLERFVARATIGGGISEKFWVGTIAELHKNKGLDNLITAFASVSETHSDAILLIIGEGEERKALTELVSKLNLTKKVHLIGFMENAATFLKAFDVFVLASRTEAFPYVPLEAGLAQLPVVATRVGGIPEVIVDGKNGLLVSPGNLHDLSEAIKNLLEDSAKAAILGHNLRKVVETNFSIDSMVEKTKTLYN